MTSGRIDDALQACWTPAFRHSAGRLGSRYLAAIREGRMLGWRTGRPRAPTVPPRDTGSDGDWVEVGPGAELLSFAPSAWVSGDDAPPAGFVLGRVRVDGVQAAVLALLRLDEAAARRGLRLTARFPEPGAAGPPGRFWFVPEASQDAADPR